MKKEQLREIIQLIGFSAMLGGFMASIGWSAPIVTIIVGFFILIATCYDSFLEDN